MLLATGAAFANPADPQEDSVQSQFEDSVQSQFERLTSTLKAEGEWTLDAAADLASQAVEKSQEAIAEAQTELVPRLQALGKLLSEQKGRLDTLAEDWGPQFDAWREAAASSLAELQRSTAEALDWFHDWMVERSEPEEPIEIRV